MNRPRTSVTVKRVRATVGDILQYRYRYDACSSGRTTARITAVLDGGAGFVVEGLITVKAADVLVVIPMHEPECEELV